MMKTTGKSLVLSVLVSLGILAFVNMTKTEQVARDVETLEVAAGGFEGADSTSSAAQVHCYDVATADELDVRTRMDFEARTSAGWVTDDGRREGALCLVESPAVVEKRLAESAR